MKRIVKWLIPCLVACFMVVGLVQTASFTFANEEVQTEIVGSSDDLNAGNSNEGSDTDVEGNPEESSEDEPEVDEESNVNSYTLPLTEDEEEFVDPDPAVISPLVSGEVAPVVPDHAKTITKLEEGTDQYQLDLNIKGSSTTEYYKKKVDVLLVIDVSYSMVGSKIDELKKAIYGEKIGTNDGEDGLADSILENDQIDAQMAIVTYATEAFYFRPWTSNLNDFENSVSNIKALGGQWSDAGGTNSTAGLIKAKEALQKQEVADDGAEKYVIFLTDGKPTYYVGSKVKTGPIDIEKSGINLSESNITGYEDYFYGTDRSNNVNVYQKEVNYEFVNVKTTLQKPQYYPSFLNPNEHVDVGANGEPIPKTSEGWHWDWWNLKWQYGYYVENASYYQYQYDETEKTYGDGGEFEILGAMYSTICARSIATSIGEDNFYSIGYGSEATTPGEVCYQYLDNMPGEFIQATNSSTLVEFFKKIAAEAMTYEISSVTINDVLSDYVELPSGTTEEKIVLSVKKTDGTPINVSDLGIKLDVTIGKDGKTISANLLKTDGTPYTLNQDFIYTISIPIQPSQAAYNYYSEHLDYPDQAYPVKDNDENKGFYSNADSGVNISYKYKEKEYTNPYIEKPVVQVTMNSIEISKEVTGSYGDKTKKFDFELRLKDENENLVTDNCGSISNSGITFNENGIYKFSLSNGEKLKIENLPKNFTYEVVETPYNNYTTTYTTYDEQNNPVSETDPVSGTFNLSELEVKVNVVNEAKDIADTGITDNTPKGLGLIGTIVVEIAAIAFVLKKKRQLKM